MLSLALTGELLERECDWIGIIRQQKPFGNPSPVFEDCLLLSFLDCLVPRITGEGTV